MLSLISHVQPCSPAVLSPAGSDRGRATFTLPIHCGFKQDNKMSRDVKIKPLKRNNLSDLAMACMQQRDMLMKDEEEALVCKVVSIPLSRSLVFSSNSICRGTRFNSVLIWGRYKAALVRISTSCQERQTAGYQKLFL